MTWAIPARAGGTDLPDNGTEALGRGGAFTAKADDPTAIYYNVAGLAQQRGTRLLLNANLSRSTLDFERAGVYPGDPTTQSYAGKPFPRAESEGGFSAIPFAALTSDFGLENATFAVGTFAPPAIGNRVYPLNTSSGLPSPVRYDSVGGISSLVLFHTAAGAFRIGEHVEIGLAAHLVQIELGTRAVSYSTKPAGCSASAENQACDARLEAKTKAWSGTASLGAMIRPSDSVSIGLHVKGPTKIQAEGESVVTLPKTLGGRAVAPTRTLLKTELPWIMRAGVRKTFGRRIGARDARPTADVELDATYELWGVAMNPGPELTLERAPGEQGPTRRTAARSYQNTFSLRAGGSITPEGLPLPLTLRAGAYYDASATAPADTRLDTDTLAKVAVTGGAGLRFDAWHVDVAYASVFDISREVSAGRARSASSDGASIVNEGIYSGHTHVVSVGATIELDVVFGRARLPSLPSLHHGDQARAGHSR